MTPARRTVIGRAAVLRRSDVDTDQILPALYLQHTKRDGFAQGLFAGWRGQPDNPLENPTYRGANILITGPDFGTGSSREHAVWALQQAGYDAVLASRFGDIFRNNSGNSGLVAGVVAQSDIDRLMRLVEADPSTEVIVDVETGEVRAGGLTLPVDVAPDARRRIMAGTDLVGETLTLGSEIAAFEARRSDLKPSVRPA